MNRYEILLGKLPPPKKKKKEKKKPLFKSDHVYREFIIGERRSGKTDSLLNDLTTTGASTREPFLLCVVSTQRNEIRHKLGEIAHLGAIQTWEDVRSGHLSRSLHGTLTRSLYFDNVNIQLFHHIMEDVEFSDINRIVATCDYRELMQTLGNSVILGGDKLRYMNHTWKLTVVSRESRVFRGIDFSTNMDMF